MADEAFALSPISARASLPSEEDYDAISQAFMETSRGRWFLGEYAKRNRNADTRMVLDAVERIEQTISAQKQPEPDDGLAEALAAIRDAVDQAQTAVAAAVEGLALEENLAPARKGARIIREISWRWREIGADGRICDLLDSQVSAIEAACGQIASSSPQPALGAAFDRIKARIAEFGDGETDVPHTAEWSVPLPSSAAADELLAAVAEALQPASMADSTKAAIGISAEAFVETAEVVEVISEAVDAMAEVADAVAEAVDAAVEAPDMPAEAADETPGTTEAYDEALLDMVALEMAAPDAAEIDDAPETAADEAAIQMPPPAEPISVAQEPEPITAPERPEVQPSLQPSLPDSVQPSLQALRGDSAQPSLQPSMQDPVQPSLQPALQEPRQDSRQDSLGSSLIASGILRKPHVSASDPLAPIRRLSQAEKIAFFS